MVKTSKNLERRMGGVRHKKRSEVRTHPKYVQAFTDPDAIAARDAGMRAGHCNKMFLYCSVSPNGTKNTETFMAVMYRELRAVAIASAIKAHALNSKRLTGDAVMRGIAEVEDSRRRKIGLYIA